MAGKDCGVCHLPEEKRTGAAYQHRGNFVKCLLCAQGCVIREGERGKCRARMNVKGELRSLVYGRPITVHVDPIEKKPFYHFLPGAAAFSLATAGCPLRCKFCQNWEISQIRPEDQPVAYVPPEKLVRAARDRQAPVIAFTYNEPTVFTEYLLDIARLAKKDGRRSVLISCGFMNEAPLTEMCERPRCDQDRPEGVQRGFLSQCLRGGVEAGPPEHPAGSEKPGAPGNRQPGRADPQRFGQNDEGALSSGLPAKSGRMCPFTSPAFTRTTSS